MRVTRAFAYSRPPPVPKMPEGLVELMEGLTRDVLQHNPPDEHLHEFCAQHMEQLLIIRDGHAPMKKRAPLELRIKKAQEKVREKAKQRRLKYDEELKKHNKGAAKSNSSSNFSKETEHETSAEEQEPNQEKVESSIEANGETKLKAPVHHEQDLSKALEVEIFHKPIEESAISLTDKNTEEQNIQEKTQLPTENLEKDDELAKIKTTELEETQRVILSDEDIIVSEEDVVKDNVIEHVRARRSLETDIAVEPKETENENITSIDLKEIDERNITESKIAEVTDNDQGNKRETSAEESAIVQNSVIRDDSIKTTSEQGIDKTTAFANEVTESAPTLETIEVDVTEMQVEKDYSPVSYNKDQAQTRHVEDKVDVTIDEYSKLSKTESKDVNGTELENQNVEKSNISAVPDTATNNTEIAVIVTENISSEEIADVEENAAKNKTDESMTIETKENEFEAKFDTSNASSKKTEERSDKITSDNEKENGNIHNIEPQNVEAGSIEKGYLKDSVSNISDIVQENETLAVNKDNMIIEVVEQLEVLTEPVERNQDNKENANQDPETGKSEDNERIAKEESDEYQSQECALQGESAVIENSDGSLTTVNKVLVEGFAGGNDDNDSAPQQINKQNIIENNVHINGNHEQIEENFRNGSESPEPERILPKEFQNIIDAQDDSTTMSEPIKTDPETSSMGKSSSMDESFIEEGVDILTHVDVSKPDAEIVQNKETPSGMDLETAAVTIQKVFRTFLFRSRGSTFEDTCEGSSTDGDSEKTEVEFPATTTPLKERRTLGISRMDTVLQTVNEEKSLSLSTDDSSLSSAATIIQAHVRGFLLRNRLNSNKTDSSTSLVNSNGPSTSMENDPEQKTNKTVLNIHIVPEGEHFLSRDESLLTSIELSLDSSPPSSTNLHPLGYDKSQPRKQLKREDAIQSISPPSNNSGKLSEDVDSVKDLLISDLDQQKNNDILTTELDNRDDTPTKSTTIETVVEAHKLTKDISSSSGLEKLEVETAVRQKGSLTKLSSDESDVVTPYEDKNSTDSDATSHLLHSGEFHDVVLPTKVSRGDTSVVRGE